MPSRAGERKMTAFLRAFEADPSLPQREIVEAIFEWQGDLTHIGAAEGLFALIAPVCARRPELTRALLEFPLRYLAYFGYDSADDEVLPWVADTLRDPYFQVEPLGRRWLEETLPTLGDEINEILGWIIRKECRRPPE